MFFNTERINNIVTDVVEKETTKALRYFDLGAKKAQKELAEVYLWPYVEAFNGARKATQAIITDLENIKPGKATEEDRLRLILSLKKCEQLLAAPLNKTSKKETSK